MRRKNGGALALYLRLSEHVGQRFVSRLPRRGRLLGGQESARLAVEDSVLTEEHVAKVDATKPGIIAHVRYMTPEGELLKGHVLIDGHHRAARCLRERRPFFAYLLTEWESLEVLLRCPEGSRPDVAEARRLREQQEETLRNSTSRGRRI